MNLHDNLHQLINNFHSLRIEEINKNSVIITGNLEVNQIINDERIFEIYKIQIDIPLNYPNELPIIKELSGKVNEEYPHRYVDTSLCLATETDMHFQLAPNYNLSNFVEKFIIPYFVSYEYYTKYKFYPFGERSHGIEGILEFYKDFFPTNDITEAYKLVKHTATSSYRGHAQCPCGSQSRLRKCHGEGIRLLQQENRIFYVQKDFEIISHTLKN